jgi:hypothetical protein
VSEIEAWIKAKGHDGGGSSGGADAGENAENSSVRVEVKVVVAGGKWKDGVQMFALNPVLVLAGSIAGVGSDFEHVDDDYFDFDWLLLSLCECTREDGKQEHSEK